MPSDFDGLDKLNQEFLQSSDQSLSTFRKDFESLPQNKQEQVKDEIDRLILASERLRNLTGWHVRKSVVEHFPAGPDDMPDIADPKVLANAIHAWITGHEFTPANIGEAIHPRPKKSVD